jgi:hypothetical protein
MTTTSNLVAEVRKVLAEAGYSGESVADDHIFTVAELQTFANLAGITTSALIARAEVTA